MGTTGKALRFLRRTVPALLVFAPVTLTARARPGQLDYATSGVGSTPEELLALIKSDLSQWGKVIRDNHIQGE